MKGSEALLAVADSMPLSDKMRFIECLPVLNALIKKYGLVATLAMSVHIALYQETIVESQSQNIGYFDYLAGKG